MTKVFYGENGGFGDYEISGDVFNVCWLIELLKNLKKYMVVKYCIWEIGLIEMENFYFVYIGIYVVMKEILL